MELINSLSGFSKSVAEFVGSFGSTPQKPVEAPPEPNGVHTAADRYAELAGTIRINGRTMKEEVTKVIGSNAYALATDGDAMNDGSRIDIVRRVVGGYRERAEAVLFRENPAITQAFELERYKKAVAKGAAKGPPAQSSSSSQLPGLPPVE